MSDITINAPITLPAPLSIDAPVSISEIQIDAPLTYGYKGDKGDDGDDANVTNANVNIAIEEDPAATRTSLGLGSAATTNSGDYATAAQGTNERVPTSDGLVSKFGTSKTSLTDNDKIAGINGSLATPVHFSWPIIKSALLNYFNGFFSDLGHTHTSADVTDLGSAATTDASDYATAAQGELADSASQPGHGHIDLVPYIGATNSLELGENPLRVDTITNAANSSLYIDLANSTLNDSSTKRVDWSLGQLNSGDGSSNLLSVDWSNRKLFKSDGFTEILDWETPKFNLNNGSYIQGGDNTYGSLQGGGVEQVCAADYRYRWEGGREWFFSTSGTYVRLVRMNFGEPQVNDDETNRFTVGSVWEHQDGRRWVCLDATTGAAVWELEDPLSQLGTAAFTDSSDYAAASHSHLSSDISDATSNASLNPEKILTTTSGGSLTLHSINFFGDVVLATTVLNKFSGSFRNNADLTAKRTYLIPDASGTLALTSDITGTNSGVNTGDQDLSGYLTLSGGNMTGNIALGLNNITFAGGQSIEDAGLIYAGAMGNGTLSINFTDRKLLDWSGVDSVQWSDRTLINSAGDQTMLDWTGSTLEAPNGLTVVGNISATGTTTSGNISATGTATAANLTTAGTLTVGSNTWNGSTITGAQAFSSTTRPTSSGTGPSNPTSLRTFNDELLEISTQNLFWNMSTVTNLSGGTGSASRGYWQLFTTATVGSSTHSLIDVGSIGYGSPLSFNRRMIVHSPSLLNGSLPAGRRFYFQLGRGFSTTVTTLNVRGFGYRIDGSTVTPFVHNGTTLTEGTTFARGTSERIILDFQPAVALYVYTRTNGTNTLQATLSSGLPSGNGAAAPMAELAFYDQGGVGGSTAFIFMGNHTLTIL